MLNIKKLLTKLVNSSEFVIKKHDSETFTIASGASTEINIDVAESGYKCIGIAGFYMTGTGSRDASIFRLYPTSGNSIVTANIKNNNAASGTWALRVYVVYQKLGGAIIDLLNLIFSRREEVGTC